VYDTDPSDPDCVVINGYWEYRPHSTAKRFTDAELAAEHHAANAAAWRLTAFRSYNKDEVEQSEHEFHTLRRFATLPHYDEATL
jgi:hypothetical protein